MVPRNDSEAAELFWKLLVQYLDGKPLGLARLSFDGEIVDCTHEFAEKLRTDKVGAIGLNIAQDLTLKADRADTKKRFENLRSTGGYIHTSKELRRNDGSTGHFDILAVALGSEYILDVISDTGRGEIASLEEKLSVAMQENVTLLSMVETLQDLFRQSTPGRDISVNVKTQTGGTNIEGSGNQVTQTTNQARVMLGVATVLLGIAGAVAYFAYTVQGNPDLEPPDINPASVTPADGSEDGNL